MKMAGVGQIPCVITHTEATNVNAVLDTSFKDQHVLVSSKLQLALTYILLSKFHLSLNIVDLINILSVCYSLHLMLLRVHL